MWDRLEQAASVAGENAKTVTAKPVYFRFLTLMAFHTYISEGFDAAVIECGIGGAFDSTNVIDKPVVTAITSLGIDHVGVLGGTIEEIAWHKAGIMRQGVKCFTPMSQPVQAKSVLEKVAVEKGAELVYVDVHPQLANGDVELGLNAEFQKINASLAIALATEWLSRMRYKNDSDDTSLDDQFRKGLKQVRWGGRCETRIESPNLTWYIDGGHTLESIALAGRWYAQQIQTRLHKPMSSKYARYLIFNQQTRDADALATALHQTLVEALKDEVPFTHVIFCTNTAFTSTSSPDLIDTNANADDVLDLKVQKQLARTWEAIVPNCHVEVVRTIEEAVKRVRDDAAADTEVTALVTGSLRLVGGFLEVIDTVPTQSSQMIAA